MNHPVISTKCINWTYRTYVYVYMYSAYIRKIATEVFKISAIDKMLSGSAAKREQSSTSRLQPATGGDASRVPVPVLIHKFRHRFVVSFIVLYVRLALFLPLTAWACQPMCRLAEWLLHDSLAYYETYATM